MKIVLEENGKKQVGTAGVLAMLSLTLMGLGSNAVTPVMATLAAHFTGRNVSFIQTVATLSMVVGSLLAGAAMGKFIRTKTLAIWGSLLCLIFGILPVWIDSFEMILVIRFVFGFALGLISPLGNSLIMMHFKGKKQAALLGIGTFSMNIGGIAFQMLSGVLADISWQLSFFGHIFFAIAFIMSFFLPGEEIQKNRKQDEEKKEKLNVKAVALIGILILVFQTVNLSVMMSASVLFEVRNAGGATVAAAALTAFSVTGMIAGLVFGPVFQKCRRSMFLLAFASVAVGAFVILTGQTALVMGAGYALIGIGFNWQFITFTAWVGIATPESTIGTGTSVLLAMMNLGGFLSSFWMILLGDNLTRILAADMILSVILAVALFAANPLKSKRDKR